MAKWDAAFINDLPDAAFALIQAGGEQDETGKTTPRSLRFLPHHRGGVESGGDDETVDRPHLRNALARLEQADLTDAEKAKARKHLEAHAEALGIGEAAEEKAMARPRRLVPASMRIALAKGGEAPKLKPGESDVPFRRWVHVANIGTQRVEGYDEPFSLSDDGARRIMALWRHDEDHGHRAIFDFGHGSLLGSTPEQQVKAGVVVEWKLEEGVALRALGEFTSQAAALIRSGGMDLASPELHGRHRDLDTGEWEDGPYVPAIALTARPQQGGLEVIAASRAWMALAEHMHMDAKAMLSMIERKVDLAAKGGIFGPIEMHGVDSYQWDVQLEEVEPDWARLVVRNSRNGTYYQAQIEHDEAVGDCRLTNIQPVRRIFEPVATGGEEQTMANKTQPLAAPKMGDALTEAQVAALAAMGERKVEDVTRALALLDAAPEATPDQVRALARGAGDMTALQDSVRLLSSTLDAAKAEIAALAQHKAALEEQQAARAAQDLVATYERQGRITPAMREHCLRMARADAAAFTAFAATMPQIVSLSERGVAGGQPGDGEPEETEATLHERIVTLAKGQAVKAGKQESEYGAFYAEALSMLRSETGTVVRDYFSVAPPPRRSAPVVSLRRE